MAPVARSMAAACCLALFLWCLVCKGRVVGHTLRLAALYKIPAGVQVHSPVACSNVHSYSFYSTLIKERREKSIA
jgi:hypothetical protein